MLDEVRKEFRLKDNVQASECLAGMFKKRKRGSLLDMIPLMVVFFMFSFGIIIGYYVLSAYQTQAGPTLPAQGDQIVQSGLNAISYMDEAGIFVFVGIIIAIIIGGYYMNVHPSLIGIGIVVLSIIVFVSGALSDAFMALVGDSNIAVAASGFPAVTSIWENMPLLIVLIGAVLLVVIYGFTGKKNGEGFS